MKNQEQLNILITNALRLASDTACDKVFLFLNSGKFCKALSVIDSFKDGKIALVIPKNQDIPKCIDKSKTVIHTWSGNQTRFSRIKYAFMQAVLQHVIQPNSRVVCVLGPWGKDHLDTITVHDLGLSWSEEFPFDPRSLITKKYFQTVIAVIDIALDIGALGREGKPVGTTFIVGNVDQVMRSSHQAIFNPFKGYPESAREITSSEVVESIKELAKLDGAFVISISGIVEAAGRHLDAVSSVTKQLKGLGSRHRAAASMTMYCEASAIVVSESTGRVTIFDEGKIIAVLDPVISNRVV
jgi:diadenylate cyclase